MLDSLKNIFAVPDLRKRVLFTLGLLAVYRVGGHIPTPGVNTEALALLAEQARRTRCSASTTCSPGRNLSQMTIFALGIMPYISASIILQLLTVVWPYLERLSKEGELGRRKITQYTRYGTILLSVVQALGIAFFLERNTGIAGGLPLVYNPGWALPADDGAHADDRHDASSCGSASRSPSAASATACRSSSSPASSSNLPHAVFTTLDQLRTGQMGPLRLLLLLRADGRRRRRDRLRRARPPARDGAVRQARRRAPDVRRVEHAHPAEGEHRRRHPGDLRLVDPGVPGDARAARSRRARGCAAAIDQLAPGMPLYNLLYVVGIIFFCYFYTAIIFNPDDVAENMRKYGGFIPGIRPGQADGGVHRHDPDADHARRRDLPGDRRDPAAVPDQRVQGRADSVHRRAARRRRCRGSSPRAWACTFYFGGTSLLIIVGVAMDTVQQVESQLIMRHYDGFMKKTRIRGRRGQ